MIIYFENEAQKAGKNKIIEIYRENDFIKDACLKGFIIKNWNEKSNSSILQLMLKIA